MAKGEVESEEVLNRKFRKRSATLMKNASEEKSKSGQGTSLYTQLICFLEIYTMFLNKYHVFVFAKKRLRCRPTEIPLSNGISGVGMMFFKRDTYLEAHYI